MAARLVTGLYIDDTIDVCYAVLIQKRRNMYRREQMEYPWFIHARRVCPYGGRLTEKCPRQWYG